ncbi:hypothetical protein FQR65_LT00472 [Abscondita terminalis]|nr:hypothetical protein FQR65_LT00472 [Abscondita terminalis]
MPCNSKTASGECKNIWLGLANEFRDECIRISGVDPKLVRKMIQGADVADERSLGCYLMCVYNKLTFLDLDGDLSSGAMVNKASYMNDAFTDKCLNEGTDEEDLCLKSLIVGKCIINGLSLA